MTASPPRRSVCAFLRRYGPGFLMLLLALAAAGCFWMWMQPPRPRASWVIEHPNWPIFTPDRSMLLDRVERWESAEDGSALSTLTGRVRLWDTTTGAERLGVVRPGTGILFAAVSPDGRWLAVEDQASELTVWDVPAARHHATLTATGAYEWKASPYPVFRFSPDSRLLAHERADRNGVVLWDVAGGRAAAELAAAHGPFAFSPDGRLLAAAAGDNRGVLWDVNAGREVVRLTGFALPIRQVAFSPDGTLLATHHAEPGGDPGEVNVWQVPSGRLRAKLPCDRPGPSNPLCDNLLTFSPDCRMLVIPCVESDPSLWDITTDPPRPLWAVVAVAVREPDTGRTWLRPSEVPTFSPDGRWMAVGPHQRAFAVLAAATRTAQSVLMPTGGDEASGDPLFSPDGTLAAVNVGHGEPKYQLVKTGGGWLDWLVPHWDRSFAGMRAVPAVEVFDVATGRALGKVPGRLCGGFTPDGHALFTAVDGQGGPDPPQIVHRWDLPLGRPAALFGAVSALVLLVVVALLWLCSRRLPGTRTGGDQPPVPV
jgi:WD40 repeat protein